MKAAVLVYGCLGGGKIDAVLRADGGAFFAERAGGGNEKSGWENFFRADLKGIPEDFGWNADVEIFALSLVNLENFKSRLVSPG